MVLKGVKRYWFRHRLISSLRDIDVKGFRWLSLILPKWLILEAALTDPYILETIHGFALEIDPRIDLGVERSLHETGTYEKGVIHFLTSKLKKGGCFVDIGANIGLLSIHASRCIGAEGSVYAIEPNPKTLPILERNIKLNNAENILVCPVALGDRSHRTHIFENVEINRGAASLITNSGDNVGIEIQVESLDELLPDILPDIIKIDVEGYELEVLKGAIFTIKRALPVLIIETAMDLSKTIECIYLINQIHPYRLCKFKNGKERKSSIIECSDYSMLPLHDNLIFFP